MKGQDWLFVWATAFTVLALVQGWWLWKEIQTNKKLHLHLLAAAQTFRDVANSIAVSDVTIDLSLRLLRYAVRFEKAADES